MEKKIKIDIPIIVEGKYDKIKLSSLIDGNIITTDGFAVFKSDEKKLLIKRLAEKNGVIVLTDSDGGGLVIRNYISSILPKEKIINLYIPEIKGREKRKKCDSKEGFLGVEGISADMITEILSPYSSDSPCKRNLGGISKTDFYEDGLSGGNGSAEKRKELCKKASLPTNISANSLLEAINLLYTYEEYKELASSLS